MSVGGGVEHLLGYRESYPVFRFSETRDSPGTGPEADYRRSGTPPATTSALACVQWYSASYLSSSPREWTAADYGASAADLEALRRLLEVRVPSVQFRGFFAIGAKRGEYVFGLPPCNRSTSASASVVVQAPTTPHGHKREGLGLWRYRLSQQRNDSRAWRRAALMETVVEWIGKVAEDSDISVNSPPRSHH